jgi:hypothetical protein
MQNSNVERRVSGDSGDGGITRHLPCGARRKIAIFYLVGTKPQKLSERRKREGKT